jgi:hypothetical protein
MIIALEDVDMTFIVMGKRCGLMVFIAVVVHSPSEVMVLAYLMAMYRVAE